jgi:alpha 1,3-glucosidase
MIFFFFGFFIILNIINKSQEKYEQIYCHEVPFCNRFMFWGEQAPIYYVDNKTISISSNIIKGTLKNFNRDYISNAHDLEFILYVLKSGLFRMKIKPIGEERFELDPEDEPFEMKKSQKRKNIKTSSSNDNIVLYYYTHKKAKYELEIKFSPFQIHYKINNKMVFFINSKNLFDIEFPGKDFKPTEEDIMQTIKLDILIPESIILSGLPERAGNVGLTDTNNDEYYHFYNIDMFKFPKKQFSGIYGFIPFIMTQSYGGNVIGGFIWNNPSETFIGVKSLNEGKNVIWMSETGIFDFSFWSSEDIDSFYKIYHRFIGKTPLPNIFSLGYHQSRYTYHNVEDMRKIDNKFDEYNIPYDSIWFDIEHTDGQRYFTYDQNNFEPSKVEKFLSELEKKGRKVIYIIDPHIKVDKWYHIYYDSMKKNYLLKYQGQNFVGKCWCGDASYLDFYNKEVRNYWRNLILKSDSYFLNSKIIHIWNDMNEPSVFDIHRNTLPKSSTFIYNNKKYEHRNAHNIYGYLMHKETYEGLREKYENKIRPFVLTRSFFIGSHKYSFLWTGDVISSFNGLEMTIPMLIQLSLSGFSFIGSDIGGFADNGDVDLYIRWYQSGVFFPFFRQHTHLHTHRREIWLFTKENFENMKLSVLIRYQILPYIYREFFKHYSKGIPIIRPLWFYYKNEMTLSKFSNNEYLFGENILVRPVLNRNEDRENKINLYLPEDERWYNFYNNEEISNKGDFDYNINKFNIGAFIKGGSVIPKKMRLRRSSLLMKKDPLTLIITLDNNNYAEGFIYFDDENNFDYEKGIYSILNVYYKDGVISNKWEKNSYKVENKIETIIISGHQNFVNSIELIKNDIKKKVEFIQYENKIIEIKRIGNENLCENFMEWEFILK